MKSNLFEIYEYIYNKIKQISPSIYLLILLVFVNFCSNHVNIYKCWVCLESCKILMRKNERKFNYQIKNNTATSEREIGKQGFDPFFWF